MPKSEKRATTIFLDQMQKNQSKEFNASRRRQMISIINRAKDLKQLKRAVLGMFS